MKLSIIIANHNYRDFVGAAIASALAVDWPKKEVIVVDDASADGSKTVIDSFGSQIGAYFRPKSHQLGAHKFGLEQSNGDVIILLDADDLLQAEVMREVARVWRPGISKVQFRLNLIDARGNQMGSAFPQFPSRNDPAQLRGLFLRTMAYTTPPGSGNAYCRDFMCRAYAMVPPSMRWSDDVLLTLAPLLGNVVTIPKPLGCYRVHGTNDGSLSAVDPIKLRNRLLQDIGKARLFEDVCGRLGLPKAADPLSRSQAHLQYRFASYLIEPAAHPFPQDALPSLLFRLAGSTITYSQMRLRHRAMLIAWAFASALSPWHRRKSLVLWRFSPASRPPSLKALLTTVASIGSPRLPRNAHGSNSPI